MTMVWDGFVDDAGKFALQKRREFAEWVKRFKGQDVILTVKRKPRRQGTQSMRYYRGVVVPSIAKASGVSDPDDYEGVHEGMAWKFLRLPDGPYGEPRRRSTAKAAMSQDEITDYINDVITWAETSIPDCRVPRPNEIEIDGVVDYEGWK